MRIDISLPPELIKRLRIASIEKYNNNRSMSRLIEELIIKGVDGEKEESIDPIILRGAILQALNIVREGKIVPVQNITKSLLPGHPEPIIKDMPALIGIEPKEVIFSIKKTKQKLKISVPCFTPKHERALRAKYDEIMKGLCDGSLHSELWCPGCEGYLRVPALGNKYFYADELDEMNKNRQIPYEHVLDKKQFTPSKEDSAPSCDINYGKMAGLTKT